MTYAGVTTSRRFCCAASSGGYFPGNRASSSDATKKAPPEHRAATGLSSENLNVPDNFRTSPDSASYFRMSRRLLRHRAEGGLTRLQEEGLFGRLRSSSTNDRNRERNKWRCSDHTWLR